MLRCKGIVRDIKSETVDYNGSSFVSTTVWVQTSKTTILDLRLSQDFPKADLPREDEEVDLEVVVSAFPRKGGGAGFRVTAVGRVFESLSV